jgi:membrane protease YdiL (CAAX protease family)
MFYVAFGPVLIEQGYPGLAPLLLAEVLILAPMGIGHLAIREHQLKGNWQLRKTVWLRKSMPAKSFIGWTILGVLTCFLLYAPLYPVGIYLREQVFYWLPEWYFNPVAGSATNDLVAKVFLVAIFTDGLLAPLVEEFFFRGYLLPRMAYLKEWAPVVNGVLFGLYHFWQPHNLLALIGVGMVLSYVVWKKQNIWLGVVIHCILNLLGAVAGYLAVSGEVLISR